MKNLSLSDQSRTQKNQLNNIEIDEKFSFCITVQNENEHLSISMSDTLSNLFFQHSSIFMKDTSTDSQKLDQKVHFIIMKSNHKINTNFSTLNDLLFQYNLIMKSMSENLKKLL